MLDFRFKEHADIYHGLKVAKEDRHVGKVHMYTHNFSGMH